MGWLQREINRIYTQQNQYREAALRGAVYEKLCSPMGRILPGETLHREALPDGGYINYFLQEKL